MFPESYIETLEIDHWSINLARFPINWNDTVSYNGLVGVIPNLSELNGEWRLQPKTWGQSPSCTPRTLHWKPCLWFMILFQLYIYKVSIPIFIFDFGCKVVWISPTIYGKNYRVPKGAFNPAKSKGDNENTEMLFVHHV